MGAGAGGIQCQSTVTMRFDLIPLCVQHVPHGTCQSGFVFNQENPTLWFGDDCVQD